MRRQRGTCCETRRAVMLGGGGVFSPSRYEMITHSYLNRLCRRGDERRGLRSPALHT